jgi:hypothetical protein
MCIRDRLNRLLSLKGATQQLPPLVPLLAKQYPFILVLSRCNQLVFLWQLPLRRTLQRQCW